MRERSPPWWARRAGRGDDDPAPIAVLVQKHIDPAWAGVMFGVDPVSGRSDRLVVAAVPGGPQQLVSGAEEGTRIVLDRRGHVVEGSRRRQPLSWRTRRGLARLAASVETLFGGPQDVEWAVTDGGRLLLLQSRPVTAVGAVGTGPVLGPGPVAETFPEPLRPLEQDLWLTPLREALRVVLTLTGRATRRALDRSPSPSPSKAAPPSTWICSRRGTSAGGALPCSTRGLRCAGCASPGGWAACARASPRLPLVGQRYRP